ncbi:hypothetical protein IXX73_21750 [Escherichia coli]|nr:hypothetical protein [Escherichia coli]KAA3533365.1 hypothetical protein D1170_24720 [Escherichia coli]MBA1686590.1 hypothetical protein [Escherichia coli]MBF8881002.1 hypothetical protein [Escherichia coli]MDC3489069.1 hypothetical protein [Escherichia coli]
MGHYLNIKHYQ